MHAEAGNAAGQTGDRTVDVPGGKVYVTTTGAGRGTALLVVHGGPGWPHDYLLPLTALGDDRPVVLYDQLGCGRSDRPVDAGLWTLERFSVELELVIDALEVDRLHLLGHSWGTMLAVDAALRRPDVLASLVLVSPCLSMRRVRADMERLKSEMPPAVLEVITEHEAAGTTDSGAYRTAALAFYQAHVCRMPVWPDVLVRADDEGNPDVYRTMWGPAEFTPIGNLRDYEREDRLGELDLPVLYLCGRHDEVTPEATEAYHRRTPGSQLAVFERSAHVPHLEETERFLDVVRRFLRASEPAGRR